MRIVSSTSASRRRASRALLATASVCGLLATTAPALAQDSASEVIGIEEITVTARKRTESLQDTPIAISAVTADGLTSRGIDNVTQIGDFTPNVKFNASMPISASNATAAIFIRGIGQNDYQLSADPGVGLYLDGVYISRGVGNVLDVLNVERIEVLRGPQGTLFGRNTIGGAVSVVTAKPGDTIGGNIELTTGRFNRIQAKGSIDLPLAEGIYSSFSGFYHNRDGYVKGAIPDAPDLGDTNTLAGRFALRLEPSSNVTINLAVDGTRSREESAPVVALAIDETAPAAAYWNAAYSGAAAICTDLANPARLTNPSCYNSQWALAPFRSASTFQTISSVFDNAGSRRYQSASDLNIWGVSGSIEWRLSDSITLKSITAYRKVTGFWTRESDHSPASIVQTKSEWTQDQFSQELQLIGSALDDKLNWVLGGYYSDESGNHEDYVSIVDAVFLSGAVLKGRSTAAFAQASYDIVENLSLTGGIRWTEDKKTFGNDNQYVIEAGFLTGAPFNPDGSGLANGDPLMGPLGSRASQTDKAWTPMASLSYRWSPEILTYISYSKGFKGGGFTQRVFPPFANIPSFKPEKSTTYEFGFKTDLLDRRLRLNGALFWNDYSELQVTVNDPSLGFAPIIQNAAKARIKGIELELQARPTEALRIEAGLGYLDAGYRSVDIRALNAGVNVNSKLQNAPKWTLSSGISYAIPAGDLGKFTPRVDWSYRSKVYNDAVNSPSLVQGGYHIVNAAIAYTDTTDKWLVTLGVKNLTKEVYLNSGYIDSFGGVTEGVYGRPREWYLSARYNF